MPAKITKGAMYLLIGELGLSLMYLVSGDDLRLEIESWLAATSDNVWQQGKIWTLISGAFLHAQFVSLLFHGLILWMFVPVLERWWGTKRFLFFALWTTLAGTIAGTLVGLWVGNGHISGLDPFIYGTIVAYGVLYSTSHVQFFGVLPMTGKQLAIGMVGFVAVMILWTQDWAHGAAYAAAISLAYLMTSGKWTPKLWYLRHKQKRLRRHLKVVKDEPKRWLN